jgi:hypothetical protein
MEFICKKTDICPYKKELNDLKGRACAGKIRAGRFKVKAL